MKTNIYNSLPASIFQTDYLWFQPNRQSLNWYSNFVDQLKSGLWSGLWLYENNKKAQSQELKQIKIIENYNKELEPIVKENEDYEKKQEYDKWFLGKIENIFKDNNFLKDIINKFDFNYTQIFFFIVLFIILIKI